MIELNHKHIVVTFLMHLGDVILTSPFVEVLRRAAPNSHITYVIDEKLADVMRYSPYIDRLVVVDKKGKHNSIRGLNEIARQIRQDKVPDIVINLHPNERTSYLAWKIGGHFTTGMSHFLFRPFMSQYIRLDRRTRHAADMYLHVLEELGVSNIENHGLHIETCPTWDKIADDFYRQSGVVDSDKVIGFNIGSAVIEKRWPKERFTLVADYFANRGYKTIFFGGQMDVDMVCDVQQLMKSSPIIGTGKFSIGELAAAMRRCQVLVTNDSGPMHVAVSQGVPIVALYGPSNPFFYGPYKSKAIVLESMDSYDIHKNMKQVIREGTYKGLSVINTDDVIHAVESIVSTGA